MATELFNGMLSILQPLESNPLLSTENLFENFNDPRNPNAINNYYKRMDADHLNDSSFFANANSEAQAIPNIVFLGAAFTRNGLLIDSLQNIQALAKANILTGMYNYYELMKKWPEYNNTYSQLCITKQKEIDPFISQFFQEREIIKKNTIEEITTMIDYAYNNLATYDSMPTYSQKKSMLQNCNNSLFKAALLIAYKKALNPQDSKINYLHEKLDRLYTFALDRYSQLFGNQ